MAAAKKAASAFIENEYMFSCLLLVCVCVRTTEQRQIKNSKKGVTTAHNRSPF